jgi:hypothetical protein
MERAKVRPKTPAARNGKGSLTDRWLVSIKNHPVIAIISVVSAIVSIVAPVVDFVEKHMTRNKDKEVTAVVKEETPPIPKPTAEGKILLNCNELGYFTVDKDKATVFGGEKPIYTADDAVPIYTGDTDYGFWMYINDTKMLRRYWLNRETFVLTHQELAVSPEERAKIQAGVKDYLAATKSKTDTTENPTHSRNRDYVAHTDQLVAKLKSEKGLQDVNRREAGCTKKELKG